MPKVYPKVCPQCDSPFGANKKRAICCSKKCSHEYRYGTDPHQRFWSKVVKSEQPDGCWTWTASTNEDGYGFIGVGPRNWAVHRYSYHLHFGEIPEGMRVCHRCDNPPCVRPDHLFLGTQKDNMQDCLKKGRFKFAIHATLTPEQVIEMRQKYTHDRPPTLEIAREYGVSTSTVKSILSRRGWKHL